MARVMERSEVVNKLLMEHGGCLEMDIPKDKQVTTYEKQIRYDKNIGKSGGFTRKGTRGR